jgi:hypothetical protein
VSARHRPPQAVDLDLVYRRGAAAGHGYVPSTPAQAPAGHDRPGPGPGRRPAVSHAQDTEPAAFRPRGSGSDVGSGFTAEYGDEPGAAPRVDAPVRPVRELRMLAAGPVPFRPVAAPPSARSGPEPPPVESIAARRAERTDPGPVPDGAAGARAPLVDPAPPARPAGSPVGGVGHGA